jgi:amino acid efflux transporter
VVWLSIAICLSLVWMLGTAMSYAVLLVLVTAPLLWWQQQWLRARVA